MDPTSRQVRAQFNDMTAYLGDVKTSQSSGEKAYLSPEGKFSAKNLVPGSQTLKALDVSEKLHIITTEARRFGILQAAKPDELSTIVSGLTTLKDRIKDKQALTPPIIRFILDLFGIEDKSTKIINQIDKTIKIVKEFSLGHEIAALSKEIVDLESNAKKVKSELDGLNKNQPKSKSEALKAEIQTLTKKVPSRAEIKKLEQAVTDTGAVKGAKEGGGFLSFNKSKAQKEYQAAVKNLSDGNALVKELQIKESALQQDQDTQKDFAISKGSKERELDSLSRQIDGKKKSLASKETELKKLQHADSSPLARIQLRLKPKGPSAKSAAMDLLDNCPPAQESKARSVKSLLNGNENPKAYLDYQQRTIFGFSVGQRQTLSKLENVGMSKENLQKLLEGGDDVVNMFYLATSLEQQIQSARSEGKPEAYIRKLEGLYKDMMRSLPLALESGTLDKKTYLANTEAISKKYKSDTTSFESTVISLSDGTKAALLKMNPGERLFVPIGTQGHSTLLVFEKGKDGVVTPSIYNTGEGAELFESAAAGIKNQFRDVKLPTSVRYPSFTLTEKTNFKGMFENIFKNRVVGGDIKELYDHASQDLGPPTKGVEKKVQISSVCSFQVLTEVISDILKEDNDQFLHDFLTRIGKDFREMSGSITIETPPSRKEDELSDREKLRVIKDLHGAMLEDNDREIQRLEAKIAAKK